MPKLRKISGKECIKALYKMGFKPVRQRGSHVVLVKLTPEGKIGTVVPLDKELKIGRSKESLRRPKWTRMNLLSLSELFVL